MEQSTANANGSLDAAEDRQRDASGGPHGAPGFSGLSARYRSFSPGRVVQSHPSQTMLLRSMQSAGVAGRGDSTIGTRDAELRQLRRATQEMSNTLDATSAQMVHVEKRVSGTEDAQKKMEDTQKKMERRFAEGTGNWKGLSEEVQSQIRRTEQLDSRLGEIRRQMTEDLRQRNMDFDQKLQKATLATRSTNTNLEEQMKKQNQRLQAVESFLEERMRHEMEATESLEHLSIRIADLEERYVSLFDMPLAPTKMEEPETPKLEGHALLLSLQQEMQDVTATLGRTTQETEELHSQLGEHEQRLNALRTLVDAKDRDLREKCQASELEVKFELLRQQIHEKSLEKDEHVDSLDLLRKQLSSQEQAHEELRSHVLRSQSSAVGTPHSGMPGNYNSSLVGHMPVGCQDGDSLADLRTHVKDTEDRIHNTVEKIVTRMETMQTTIDDMAKGGQNTGHDDILQDQTSAMSQVQETARNCHLLAGELETHKPVHQENIYKTVEKMIIRMEAMQTAIDAMEKGGKNIWNHEIQETLRKCFLLAGELETHNPMDQESSDSTPARPAEKIHKTVVRNIPRVEAMQPTIGETEAGGQNTGHHETLQEHTSDMSQIQETARRCHLLAGELETHEPVRQESLDSTSARPADDFSMLVGQASAALNSCRSLEADVKALRGDLLPVLNMSTSACSADDFSMFVGQAASELPVTQDDAGSMTIGSVASEVKKAMQCYANLQSNFQSFCEDLGSVVGEVNKAKQCCADLQLDFQSLRKDLGSMESEVNKATKQCCKDLQLELQGLREDLSSSVVSSAERAVSNLGVQPRGLPEPRAAFSDMQTVGDFAARLEQVEKQFAGAEQGLSEQRAAAEMAMHKPEVERELTDHSLAIANEGRIKELQGQIGTLIGSISELRAVQGSTRDEDFGEFFTQIGRVLEEHKAHVERALAEHRAASANREKVTELAEQIADLESRVEKLGDGPLGDVAEEERETLLRLMNTVNQDDEAEQNAHKVLLSSIDELCERFISVKSAADSGQFGINGISPEVSKRIQDAINHVQQSKQWQRRMEEQIKALRANSLLEDD